MVTDVRYSIELRGLPATQRLAESVAAVLRPGDVLGLDGDLGAGKTTFVRFLARALGVTTPVTSPTFTLANTYEARPPADRPLLIHHIDAYRLDGDADAEDLALPELLDSGGIVVVEWAERLTLPDDRLDLHFQFPPDPSAAPVSSPTERTDADPRVAARPTPTGTAPSPADTRIVTVTRRGHSWQDRPPSPPRRRR
ncbi:MAG: tRNA (adenosine(37)-N6)-threonylcarbamoyltransferase complex ATPase subunit type 1 TsaE [bacterium]|nr:tRNA (adenosine(37)-N6)-threonylcarbamoyltransferase complex ATPase subunit type 1 TsaE [bacterium]MCY3952421.1 tRNA (adenosine(37)-N6)-threonylcarbamoyltransferase complex ATPase subunit type 1 TsaE [bacterium]MCY4104559.1 tRNA (adenosine(37)-N6)-threonylcarbamoyltransferase complex ATPase subunit type 1 TsaE [bacterium]